MALAQTLFMMVGATYFCFALFLMLEVRPAAAAGPAPALVTRAPSGHCVHFLAMTHCAVAALAPLARHTPRAGATPPA